MKIISFAWTTPALLADAKTCTRRDWNDDYALRFHKGELAAGYDRLPRVHGHQVATVELTIDPYKQWTDRIPVTDWWAEGFEYLTQNHLTLNGVEPIDFWRSWHDHPRYLWVVRFRLVSREVANQEAKDGND